MTAALQAALERTLRGGLGEPGADFDAALRRIGEVAALHTVANAERDKIDWMASQMRRRGYELKARPPRSARTLHRARNVPPPHPAAGGHHGRARGSVADRYAVQAARVAV